MRNNKFMEAAVLEAHAGIRSGHGGPFGAVIVRRGKIISQAHNEVLHLNDPTAHAEILAIRKASKKLKRFDLQDCEIYSTCEPCPMCLFAVYWARMKKLYYGCTKKDADKIGFDDNYMYGLLKGIKTTNRLKIIAYGRQACLGTFKTWENIPEKVVY